MTGCGQASGDPLLVERFEEMETNVPGERSTARRRGPIPLFRFGCPGGAHWSCGMLVICALAAAGCHSADSSADLPAEEEHFPPFVAIGEPAQCPARCIRSAAYIACAELGLDPAELGEGSVPEAVFHALEKRAESVGGSIRSLPVPELLSELNEGPAPPAVLVHGYGHLYLILGALKVDGELMYQLVHGEMPISLVTKAQLLSAGFEEAWQFESDTRGLTIEVGSATVCVDKVYHNFGEVKPDEEVECAFALNNVGNTSLILGRPRASCSCTTTDVPDNTELAPGETKDIGVKFRATNSPSQRHSVLLSLFEKGSGVSRQVEALLFGSQRASMVVTPTKLDFGVVVPREECLRTVCLREVPTDRFVLKNVDLGKLPIVHDVEVAKDKDGLATYRVHLDLEVDEEWSGEHEEELSLTTDSNIRPKVTIPVLFRIKPAVRAIPSVISFGNVVIGEPREARVEFVSRYGDAVDLEVDTHPDECSITLDREKNPLVMTVALELSKPGIWHEVIILNTETRTGKEVLEVRCVGYGHNHPE